MEVEQEWSNAMVWEMVDILTRVNAQLYEFLGETS